MVSHVTDVYRSRTLWEHSPCLFIGLVFPSIQAQVGAQIAQVIARLALMSAGVDSELPFTMVVDDPSGNSFVENPSAPNKDPALSVSVCVRCCCGSCTMGGSVRKQFTLLRTRIFLHRRTSGVLVSGIPYWYVHRQSMTRGKLRRAKEQLSCSACLSVSYLLQCVYACTGLFRGSHSSHAYYSSVTPAVPLLFKHAGAYIFTHLFTRRPAFTFERQSRIC